MRVFNSKIEADVVIFQGFSFRREKKEAYLDGVGYKRRSDFSRLVFSSCMEENEAV